MTNKPTQPQDKYIIRMPDGLRERIKKYAEANNRSMNAEIVATLEEKYPAPHLDINTLSLFLDGLVGVSAPDGDKGYLEYINDALAQAHQPWTVEAGWDGAVTFYPYTNRPRSPKPDGDKE